MKAEKRKAGEAGRQYVYIYIWPYNIRHLSILQNSSNQATHKLLFNQLRQNKVLRAYSCESNPLAEATNSRLKVIFVSQHSGPTRCKK